MIEQASLVIGEGNWAVKSDSLLGYKINGGKYYLREMSVVRATTGTRINEDGLVELVPYNLLNYSEQFDNAAWVKTNATISANAIASPSGVQDADLLQSSNSTEPRIRQTTTQTGNATFSYSCFAKKGNVNFLILRNIAVNIGGGSRAWFNLDTGVIGTVNSGLTASIESVGNGWYRCNISGTTDASPTNLVDISLSATDNSISGSAIGSNIFLWGAQIEAGSYSTSYIPTQSATVTRNADVISKTGISSLINSEEGVLYFEGSVLDLSTTNSWISISEDANINNNQFNLRFVADTNLIQVVSRAGGLGQDVVLQYTLTDKTTTNKIAIKYKLNDWALWVNGVEVDTETSSNAFTPNSLDVLDFDRGNNSSYFYGNVKALALWKTALTDTQLATLTTI